jgi:hypothetical protein
VVGYSLPLYQKTFSASPTCISRILTQQRWTIPEIKFTMGDQFIFNKSIVSEKSLNVWDYKPWWCQPWSIILTGVFLVIASWLLIENLWLTVFFSFLILIWWIYFLIIYPQIVSKIIEKEKMGQT